MHYGRVPGRAEEQAAGDLARGEQPVRVATAVMAVKQA